MAEKSDKEQIKGILEEFPEDAVKAAIKEMGLVICKEEGVAVSVVDDEETAAGIDEEIAAIQENVDGLRKKPEFEAEFADAVKSLEEEVCELRALRAQVLMPGRTLDGALENIEAGIAKAKAELEQRAEEAKLPPWIKRTLIITGRWLITIERWVYWIARFIPWPPWRNRLRRIARTLTMIGRLLIWIALRFCEEASA